MRKTEIALALLLVAWMCGCSSSTPSKAPEQTSSAPAAQPAPAAKPPETTALTGREGFQKAFVAAHMWAPDARPYRIQSTSTQDATGKDGKAAIWQAGFASAMKRNIKTFIWSGSHAEGAPDPGISSTAEDTYNPTSSSTRVFDPIYLKSDTDSAFAVAQKHGGEKLTKKKADQRIGYLADWDPRESKLIWHVYYGDRPGDAALNVAVDATTGAFLRVEK